MSVRGCVLVGIEGTHASGKTTLVHALTAHYRQRGVLVDCAPEPARTSPFIEETVIHGKGGFDLACEVDLFAAQLSATLRAARHHALLICDKTVVNVLAYARMVLAPEPGGTDAAVLEAMSGLCAAWAPASYDAVFYLPDRFDHPADPMRAKVAHLQAETAEAVRATCADVGLPLVDLPAGLDTAGRVAWIILRVDPLLAGATG
ncbi:ATP-binding protein [Micromonospora sp. WMMD1082]|uniref:ATP/GTP-binding protein n=1 Tax=Micromonospora sp. WMMD1082 TaxID=3016104 RepID=UPI00241799EF|nr:ATP-binding protein [Micromonospora sp. WMMD1082]MDG4797183.1 ATP-binding protein [Micromonospora sp. WMMD1082]